MTSDEVARRVSPPAETDTEAAIASKEWSRRLANLHRLGHLERRRRAVSTDRGFFAYEYQLANATAGPRGFPASSVFDLARNDRSEAASHFGR